MNDSDKNLLARLFDLEVQQLRGKSIPEMLDSLKDRRAQLIKAVAERYRGQAINGEPVQHSKQVFDHFHRLKYAPQEEFHILLLNAEQCLIRELNIFIGTLNQSLYHPREIFAPAIEHRAHSVILVHNHPSGLCDPSPQDIELTRRLCQAGQVIGIRVLDHVIIGSDYYSFSDRHQMPDLR